MNRLRRIWNARFNSSLEYDVDESPTVGHMVIAVLVVVAFCVLGSALSVNMG